MGNTLKAADLHRALHNSLLFVGKDATLPMLELVRLEFSTDKLVAASTDRFRLGVTRADYTGEEFIAGINRRDAERVAKVAKTSPRDGRNISRVQAEDRSVDIEHDEKTITFVFSTGETLKIELQDYDFPKYRQLIPEERFNDVPGQIAVNPTYLADFTKVIDSGFRSYQVALSLGDTPGKPVLVRVGPDFVGLIMPVRAPEGLTWNWKRPNWL